MSYPIVSDLKIWLRLPSTADDELDSRLAELLGAAVDHVEIACGTSFNPSVADMPDRVALAVKVLAGFWFENPLPDEKETASAMSAVNILIAGNRVFTFGDSDAE
jgi:Phage gp6-like head-tail connector protein